MKKSAVVIFALLIAFASEAAYANGGPAGGNSALVGGSIRFENTPDIFVEKEDLSITVTPLNTTVTVEYTLKNSGKARELEYVFPVVNYLHYEYNSEALLEWIVFTDNGKKLSYVLSNETIDGGFDVWGNASIFNLKDDSSFADALDGQEIWYSKTSNSYYRTKLSFAEGETKILTVSYKTDNYYISGGTNQYPFLSYSNTVFLYDFRPAGYWGDGKAGEFNLRVDYTALTRAREISINMGSFTRGASGIFIYSEKDFDFLNAGILSIIVDYPFEYEDWKNNSASWLDSVYASSTLPGANERYSVRNLFDNNLDTVWSTNGSGVGAVIELKFKDNIFGDGATMFILNGFVQSRDLYYANARIKELKVEYSYVRDGKREIYSELIKFDDISYEQINKTLPLDAAKSFRLHYSGMRLTILDVYPGQKYEDVCLSQIYFAAWGGPDTKPDYKVSAIPLFDWNTTEEPVATTETSNTTLHTTTDSPTTAAAETTAAASIPPTTSIAAETTQDKTAEPSDKNNITGIILAITATAVLLGVGAFGGFYYVKSKKIK